VTGSEALSMVAMVRMGTSTHSVNTDQRRLELCGDATTACGGATPTATIPGEGLAIPGNWMVFGLNLDGVPSVAEILKVT
jgi:galactose oxidase